jgi:hypothetical protein
MKGLKRRNPRMMEYRTFVPVVLRQGVAHVTRPDECHILDAQLALLTNLLVSLCILSAAAPLMSPPLTLMPDHNLTRSIYRTSTMYRPLLKVPNVAARLQISRRSLQHRWLNMNLAGQSRQTRTGVSMFSIPRFHLSSH